MKINQISPQESIFTEVLKMLAVSPKTLYFYGKMPKNVVFGAKNGISTDGLGGNFAGSSGGILAEYGKRPKCVAIVGARKYTSYGEEIAYRLAFEAAKAGAVVISGLALGIDSIAHRGALDAGGVTIAVLGTPIDQIYPASHSGLAKEIVNRGGAVISEYGPGERAESGKETAARFLHRNRLISGLSDVVLVAEAAERSGSLNTASHAIAQGKELFAAPADVTRKTSLGCNKLIASGANVYLEPDDVLKVLFPGKRRKKELYYPNTEVERRILRSITHGIRDGEEMIKNGISPAEFLQVITLLEIKGVVKALGMNKWALLKEVKM